MRLPDVLEHLAPLLPQLPGSSSRGLSCRLEWVLWSKVKIEVCAKGLGLPRARFVRGH